MSFLSPLDKNLIRIKMSFLFREEDLKQNAASENYFNLN
jgi:hypothetical protein